MGIETLVMWDTTSADTALHSRPYAMVRSALRGRPGSIVLMHCNRSLSADLLPRIIRGYRARGFRFVTIPELLSGDRQDAPSSRRMTSTASAPPVAAASGRPVCRVRNITQDTLGRSLNPNPPMGLTG